MGAGSSDAAHAPTEAFTGESDHGRSTVEDLLTDLMESAVFADKVRSVGEERIFVQDLLKFLLGEPHRGIATNIIAADAEHGRRRDDKHPYSCHDQMLIKTANDTSAPSAGTKPGPGSSVDNADPSTCQSASSTTHDSPTHHSPASRTSSPTPSDSPQTNAASELPIPNPKSKIENVPTSNDAQLEGLLRAGLSREAARHVRHTDKLGRLREAQASGRPCMFTFHPDDGEFPRHRHVVDDPGWQPTKPNRQDEIAAVQDYLARLRAENERNKLTAAIPDL